ncbi:hypothetical protein HOY80DRAFT_976915 [Tuber brumale]|nr:hypothetical protein HOY80DRAFT_976915 [Tuber brumale]
MMSELRRCTRCGASKAHEHFNADRAGVLKRTCRLCLDKNKVTKRKRLAGRCTDVLEERASSIRPLEEGEENVDWRYCTACQQTKLIGDFDCDGRGQPRLSCRICLIGICLPPVSTNQGVQDTEQVVDSELALGPSQPPIQREVEAIAGLQNTMRGVQGGTRWCGVCHIERSVVEFGYHPGGNQQQCCQNCLVCYWT